MCYNKFYNLATFKIIGGSNSTQRQYISGTNTIVMQSQKTNASGSLQSPPPYHLVSQEATPHTTTFYQSNQTHYNQTQLAPNNNNTTEVEILESQNKDIEFRRYSIKLYHLQRTIKALVYV